MPGFAERYWTAEDVRALPDDGNRYECIDGALLVTPSPRGPHQLALSVLMLRVGVYARQQGLGPMLWSPADLELAPGTIVQPDLFLPILRPGAWRGAQWPDVVGLALAIEVVSPSTARRDRGEKREFYQRVGVAEYWVVDLDARRVERWRPDDTAPEVLSARLVWSPAGVAAPFELDLLEFFAEVCGE